MNTASKAAAIIATVAVILAALACGGTSAVSFEDDSGLTYELNQAGRTATVTGHDGSVGGSLVIPSTVTYNGAEYGVTAIGDGAFMGCSGLTSIQIASERLTVGDGAFDLAAGGEPVDVEIFTDAEAFPETAFGTGTNPIYDAYDNYGIPETDEVMQGALIWIVIAIILGVVFLAVHVRGKRA